MNGGSAGPNDGIKQLSQWGLADSAGISRDSFFGEPDFCESLEHMATHRRVPSLDSSMNPGGMRNRSASAASNTGST